MFVYKELLAFLELYKSQINTEANKLSNCFMPQVTDDLFALFEQTGNRIQYEEVYFARRKFLAVFGLKALLEKEEQHTVSKRTVQKLSEVMKGICEESCWALPAHVNCREENWRITVDLFAAETAQTLSELADQFREELPQEIYTQVVDAIERRVFKPFFSSEVPYGEWEQSNHNWNAVCAGSIGSACLHLMRDKKEYLDNCLNRICDSLTYYIDGFAEDGACMEGLGYFTYGMTFFVNFTQELYDYTHGEWDILCGDWAGFRKGEVDKRAKIAAFQGKCYFADGQTISFSDGNSHEKFRVGLSSVLARCFEEAELPDISRAADLFSDPCYRFVALRMDLTETKRYLEWLEKENTTGDKTCFGSEVFHVLPDAQWCIASSQNGVGMACKGGHNGEPHNHNDIGHFIYEAEGVTFFTDLGAGEYTKNYFSEGRYDILCNRSLGHSVPIINGQEQCAGEVYGCSKFQAEVRKTQKNRENQEGAGTGVIDMEFHGAYGEDAVKSCHRNFRFSLADGQLCVEDNFVLQESACASIVENLVTQILPEVDGNLIILQHQGASAILYISDLEDEGEVTVREYEHSNHAGRMEKVYAIEWEIEVKDGKAQSNWNCVIIKDREHREAADWK